MLAPHLLCAGASLSPLPSGGCFNSGSHPRTWAGPLRPRSRSHRLPRGLEARGATCSQAQPARRCAGSRRVGAGEAGVPNDSPALQPGKELARAPSPHDTGKEPSGLLGALRPSQGCGGSRGLGQPPPLPAAAAAAAATSSRRWPTPSSRPRPACRLSVARLCFREPQESPSEASLADPKDALAQRGEDGLTRRPGMSELKSFSELLTCD